MFSVIVAADRNNGIGLNGNLPWPSIKGDMTFFRNITTRTNDEEKYNALIMGSKTYLSIPKKFRPLKDRLNIVLTRKEIAKFRIENDIPDDVFVANNLNEAFYYAETTGEVEHIFIIGGSEVYAEAMKKSPQIIYVTHILEPEFMCDTYLPPLPANYVKKDVSEIKKEGDISYQFVSYVKSQ